MAVVLWKAAVTAATQKGLDLAFSCVFCPCLPTLRVLCAFNGYFKANEKADLSAATPLAPCPSLPSP